MFYFSKKIILFILIIVATACSNDHQSEETKKQAHLDAIAGLPESLKKIDKLSMYSIKDQSYDTVVFKRQHVFGSNDNVIFNGYTGDIAVDNQNRLYIAVTKPGVVKIHVFNPDGSYKNTFLQEGRGPGEFVKISDMLLNDNKLYIFGSVLQKIAIFSLDSYSLDKEMKVSRDSLKDSLSILKAEDILARTIDNEFIFKFDSGGITNPNMLDSIYFFKSSQGGTIAEEAIIAQRKETYYDPQKRTSSDGNIRLPKAMPFSRSSLITASDKLLYTAWTNYFFVKIFDKEGNYKRAFYYPYEQSPLAISKVDLGESRRELVKEHSQKVPDSWPTLHNMVVDDENRLWVFTITDSDSTYKGWVLDTNGNLLARFDWPGRRAERNPGIPPLFKVKNGFVYTRERNIQKGIDQIVKYKIRFSQN